MSRFALAAGLVLLLSVSLVLSAPARLLGALLPPEQVLLQGLEGTVWRGSASRALVRAPAGYLHLGTVHWSLHPLSLLLLAPSVDIESSWGTQTMAGELVWRGSGDVDLRRFEANVSADLLRQFAPVSLAGTLSLQLQELLLRDGLPARGAGRLVWQNGAWPTAQGVLPLGTYALEFRKEPEEALTGKVVTLSGPVEASGVVELRERDYLVDLLLSGRGLQEPQLQQALGLIARPVDQGYRIKLEGELQAPPGG
jgi:general secretion pathway protein N